MTFHTYIMACASNTAIYVGVTGNLAARVVQHRLGAGSVHTAKYRIRKLVYFETFETHAAAIARERLVKRWRRAWKDDLINRANPGWADLALETSFL